jgi:hypothetical protein
MSEKLKTRKTNKSGSQSREKAGRTTIPVTVAIQEAEDLYVWCMKDREVLVRSGLDWKLVDDLPRKIDALRETQAKWQAEFDYHKGYKSEWKHALNGALALRNELVHVFFHAFYKNEKEYAKVREIKKGNTNAHMIQNLIDLATFGMDHTNELKAVGFDLNLLKTARARSFEIAEILAKAINAGMESNSTLELRNVSYHQLQAEVKEIRRIGQYVHWRNDAMLKGYTSNYWLVMNAKSKKLKSLKNQVSMRKGSPKMGEKIN